jgi:hypothetical protein
VLKDKFLEEQKHTVAFQASEHDQVGGGEPISHIGRMRLLSRWPIERRVTDSIAGTVKMGADEEEDKKHRFQIMDNTVRKSEQ